MVKLQNFDSLVFNFEDLPRKMAVACQKTYTYWPVVGCQFNKDQCALMARVVALFNENMDFIINHLYLLSWIRTTRT